MQVVLPDGQTGQKISNSPVGLLLRKENWYFPKAFCGKVGNSLAEVSQYADQSGPACHSSFRIGARADLAGFPLEIVNGSKLDYTSHLRPSNSRITCYNGIAGAPIAKLQRNVFRQPGTEAAVTLVARNHHCCSSFVQSVHAKKNWK